MKALGVGLWSFSLTDVEVERAGPRRADGGPARCGGRPGRNCRRDPLAPVAHPHRHGGHGRGGGRRGPGGADVQPVLTVAEMQAVDAAAAATTALDVLVERAGTAVALAALELLGGAYGRRVVLIAARATTVPTAGWRPASWPVVAPGSRWSPRARPARSGTPGRRVDLVVDAAFGTGFRGTYDAPAVAARGPGAGRRHPLGGGRRHRGGARPGPGGRRRTVTFVAPKPGLLQGDGVRLAGEIEVVDIGLAVGGHLVGLIEDADVAALLARRAVGQQVVGGRGRLRRVAGHDRGGRTVRPGRLPGRRRHGPPRGAGGDLAALPATEAVGVTAARREWAAAALDRWPPGAGPSWWVPGSGGPPGTGDEVRRLVAGAPCRSWSTPTGSTPSAGSTATRSGRRAPVVLTPHDGEYERLLGHAPGPDRVAAARRLAAATGAVVLLKGPTTAVADPVGPGAAGHGRHPGAWPRPAPATCCPG